MGARAAWLSLGVLAFGTGAMSHARERAPDVSAIAVEHTEGTVHGFLELTSEDGTLLAHGDLLQTPREGGISSRMVFHFATGSVFEETVTFSQRDVFTMQTYHLVQSGPAFADDIDVSLSRAGTYSVKTKSHKDGKERTLAGRIALPADVYNGMVSTIAKNVSSTKPTTIHIVAFLPEPRVLALELSPSAAEQISIGGHREAAVNFTVKPKLPLVMHVEAKLAGKLPPDSHIWMITDDVPAFVRSEGPLYSGPVWRIALSNPTWTR